MASTEHPLPSPLLFWYPFRSPEVKAICGNLTPEESARLKESSHSIGAKIGLLISASYTSVFIVFLTSRHDLSISWTLLIGFIIAISAGFLLDIFVAAPLRKRQREILCDTAYAKTKGLTAEKLRLYSFKLD